ncbi:glycosyltransferase family 4 protein [Verrucosispora sp. CWR15]|uniref:Glycosyltransferase family 4 protein n=1 Tax=Verrucosispora sioxanthis TaxID=2499994 RepID=A0A6M1LDB8_9ACTN|nr:glycosyltransferase family 4 protein [Verrucosispora sioxanthis]NEE67107.1 glycosyltransferase family 4 protein [Verrucosispora sioxanthis]NGM16217.1 glycosyltransferase family 4 protein [Verrucosispora sioxanthis]
MILSVGRLHPQKRYDVLVDAAARWRERTAAGGRDRRQYLPAAGRAD